MVSIATMTAIREQEEARVASGKYTPAISEKEAKTQARLLWTLADPMRLRILNLLLRHEDELCVEDIVKTFHLSQPTQSHHLGLLRRVGLIGCRNRGLYRYYYVNREKLQEAQEIIGQLL